MVNLEGNKSIKEKLYDFYDKKYKLLLIIPFVVLLLAIVQIAYQIHTTGDFIKKDVSLKGGVTITVPFEKPFEPGKLQEEISSKFPGYEVVVRSLKSTGTTIGFIVEADIDGNNKEDIQKLLDSISSSIGENISKINYGLEIIGSTLGQSFFRESLIAIAVAFAFMAIVVFLYFRTFIPSLAVVLAGFSDMVIAMAAINLMGVRVGTAGIAAFLMVIGYSVDTDILLTVRVLKRKEGTVMDRILGAIKTGMTETMTAIVAVVVAMIVIQYSSG